MKAKTASKITFHHFENRMQNKAVRLRYALLGAYTYAHSGGFLDNGHPAMFSLKAGSIT